MAKLSKTKLTDRYYRERRFVETLRDKLDALANSQLKEDRQYGGKKSKDIVDGKNSKRKKRTQPRSASRLKTEIHLLLNSVNIHPHANVEDLPLANREESWLIRLDWDGIFHRPADTDFSEAYARARQEIAEEENMIKQYDRDAELSNYTARDYHLEDSPVWQFMRQFDNYAKSHGKICRQLAEMNIPPAVVSKMNFFDFSEVLYTWSKKYQIKPFESARSRNLKMFEKCYGEEFSHIMKMLHYSPAYIASVRDKMRNGICDPLLNFHHQTNVSRFKELKDRSQINSFSNMLLTFVQPHHRILHFANGYDAPKGLVFFGGYDPLYQIKRDHERERLYLEQHQTKPKARNAGNSR